MRLKHAQIKASVRINQSMLEFYWELGHDINALQNTYSWGSGFFEKLSLDLRNEFSGQEGYSSPTLDTSKIGIHFIVNVIQFVTKLVTN